MYTNRTLVSMLKTDIQSQVDREQDGSQGSRLLLPSLKKHVPYPETYLLKDKVNFHKLTSDLHTYHPLNLSTHSKTMNKDTVLKRRFERL